MKNWISNENESKTINDNKLLMDNLPFEMIDKIYKMLKIRDRLNFSVINREYYLSFNVSSYHLINNTSIIKLRKNRIKKIKKMINYKSTLNYDTKLNQTLNINILNKEIINIKELLSNKIKLNSLYSDWYVTCYNVMLIYNLSFFLFF